MFSVAKIFVLLSVLSVATAMPSHIARNPHAHHELAARVASPEPIAAPVEVFEKRVIPPQNRRRKRASNGRCSPGSSSAPVPSSSPAAVPSSTNVFVPSSTPEPSSSTPKPHSSTAKPSSTAADPPATTSNSSSGGGGSALDKLLSTTFTGDGTFYGTGLGACGITNKDTDFIAAASELFFDVFPGYNGANPNNNPMCGRKVAVEYQGKSVTVTLVDRCTACAYGALDFSPAAFNTIADPATGRIHDISWHFI